MRRIHPSLVSLLAVACLTAPAGYRTASGEDAGGENCRHHEAGHQHEHPSSRPPGKGTDSVCLDPAVAAKYAPVRFSELFVAPTGPKGLEYTARIREFEGKLVRITGFMVRQVNADPGVFMLTEAPVSTLEHEYGIVDSVPPNVVHVLLTARAGHGTAWQPYAVTVHGRLDLDGRQEADGRISYVRIQVDHITVGERQALIDVMRPTGERDVNLGRHRH